MLNLVLKQRKYLGLFGLFLVVLIVRLWYIRQYPDGYMISSDGLLYSNIAENFLTGKGLINTIRDRNYVVGPIYPLFIAFIYLISGLKNYVAVVMVQAVISALTAILIYKIGEQLFGPRKALIPYLLFLAYPLFSYWNVYILTETLFVFMVTLFLYCVTLYNDALVRGQRMLKYSILIGVVLGLSNLVRPLLLLVFPVLFFWQWLSNSWNLRKVLKDFMAVLLITCVVMSPWWVRNYLRFHEFIPTTNYGSFELYAGNNPYTVTDDFFATTLTSTYDQEVKARLAQLPVSEQEKAYTQLAVNYILSHPWQFVQRTVAKEKNLFWQPIAAWEAEILQLRGYTWDKWYLMLGLGGVLLGFFQFRRYGFLILLTGYYSTMVSVITIVFGGRYRLPIMPVVIILGSIVLVKLIQGLKLISKRFSPK